MSKHYEIETQDNGAHWLCEGRWIAATISGCTKRTAQDIANALNSAEREKIDEIGWVIVRDLPDEGIGYFDGIKFAPDNLAAIRFSRKDDADRMLTIMHDGQENNDRVEEHRWISP